MYKTRAAIGRTLQGLAAHSSLLQKPFIWYGNMFLRLTHAVSRQQEYAADALGAGIVGTGPKISGLKTIHSAGEAYGAFWSGEAVPVLNAGFRPSRMDGFSRFLIARSVTTAIAGTLAEEMQRAQVNPYDTHPPLRERVAAIEELPPGAAPADEPSAISLLDGVLELERQLLAMMGSAEDAAKLQPVNWEEVGVCVFLPQWQAVAQKHASGLAGVKPRRCRSGRNSWRCLRVLSQATPAAQWPPEQAARFAAFVVGAAMAVALHGRRIGMRCLPGTPVSFHQVDQNIEPFNALIGLATGQLAAENWQTQCAAFGISQLDLGQVGAAALPS